MNDSLPIRDIHLPEAVSWWPPAIGWWIILLVILLLVIVGYLLWKRLTRPKLSKGAEVELGELVSDYRQHQDAHTLLKSLSVFFKRTGMSYLDRNQVAGESGLAWYQKVNELVKGDPLTRRQIELLSRAPYQKSLAIGSHEIDELIEHCEQWVTALPVNKVKQDD